LRQSRLIIIIAMVLFTAIITLLYFIESRSLLVVVELEPQTFWGKYSFGAVQVIATNGPYTVSKTYYIRPWARLVAIRINKASLLQKPRYIGNSQRNLAAVQVLLYLYDKRGRLCIRAARLTTFEYFLGKTGNPLKAGRLAYKHPDALLRTRTIHFPFSSFSPCIYIGKELAKIAKTIKATHRVKVLQPSSRQLRLLGKDAELELLYPQLYEQRRSPPQQWLRSIVPREVASDAWYMFATRYSYGLLFPADKYSLGDALATALTKWYCKHAERGDQEIAMGLITMDQLVKCLQIPRTVHWRSQLAPGTILKRLNIAPIAVLDTYCDNCPTEILIIGTAFATGLIQYTTEGISLLGVIMYPEPVLVNKLVASPCAGVVIDNRRREMILYAPMNDTYATDGAIVLYYVNKTFLGGKEYWEIIPIYAGTIIHYYDYNYASMNCANFALDEPNTMLYKAQRAQNYLLGGLVSRNTTLYKRLLYADFTISITLNKCTKTPRYARLLAGLVASATNNAVNELINYMPCVNEVYDLIEESIIDLGTKTSTFHVSLDSTNKKYWVYIRVEKLVPEDIASLYSLGTMCLPSDPIYYVRARVAQPPRFH